MSTSMCCVNPNENKVVVLAGFYIKVVRFRSLWTWPGGRDSRGIRRKVKTKKIDGRTAEFNNNRYLLQRFNCTGKYQNQAFGACTEVA